MTSTFPLTQHIVATPDTCGGQPRIAGSRIRVKDIVLWHLHQKMTPAEIVSKWPHLTLAAVYAALSYYHDHRESMNAEILADLAWHEEQRAARPSVVQESSQPARPRMPQTIRFRLDEDVGHVSADGLRRRGIEAENELTPVS